MKINCTKCKSLIPDSGINFSQGICHCPKCGEYFRLAEYLRAGEEVRRIQKPLFSNIEFFRSPEETLIKIPARGLETSTYFTILFALLWNLICWPVMLKSTFTLFNLPFMIAGIYLVLLVVFQVKGTLQVQYDRRQIVVAWELFGWRFRRRRSSDELMKIAEETVYTKNYQPVYGIGLFFKKGKTLKFGSWLKEEERKWLIGELYESKFQFEKGKMTGMGKLY